MPIVRKRIQVLVPKSSRHPYNLVSLSFKTFSTPCSDEATIGTLMFHLHDIISRRIFSGTFEIVNDYGPVGSMDLEMTFNYGLFGFGYSNQLQDELHEPREMVQYSLLPRVKPLETEEQLDGVIELGQVSRPRYIEPADNTDMVKLERPKDEQPDTREIHMFHDKYSSMEDRVSRILFLNERISSRHEKKEKAAFRDSRKVGYDIVSSDVFKTQSSKLQRPLNLDKPLPKPALSDNISSVKRSDSNDSLESEASSTHESQDQLSELDDKPQYILEEELFRLINDANRQGVQDFFQSHRTSALLQLLLTFAYVNRVSHSESGSKTSNNNINLGQKGDRGSRILAASMKNLSASMNQLMLQGSQAQKPFFNHDPDILQEAYELLGPSVTPLNFIQIACMMGEEDIALDILDFVYKHTHSKSKKLLLLEFLGKTWGDGNTTLHLASFQGMSELVQKMLDYGANANKKNGRGYKPVDCADDDSTRVLFRNIHDVTRVRRTSVSHGSLSSNKGTKSVDRKESAPSKISMDLSSAEKPRPQTIPAPVTIIEPTPSEPPVTKPSLPRSVSESSAVAPFAIANRVRSSSIRRIDAPLKQQKTRLLWEPNCLLLDYSKNGELDKMKELVKQSYENRKIVVERNSVYAPAEPSLDINYHSPHTGLTPLHMACAYAHLEIAKYLIDDLKADVLVRDNEGWSILHSCIAEIPEPQSFSDNSTSEDKEVRQKFLKTLQYLLSISNIDYQALTADGETILDVIREIEETGDLDEEVKSIIDKVLSEKGISLDVRESCSDYDDEETTADSLADSGNYLAKSSPPTATPHTTPRSSGAEPLKSGVKSDDNTTKSSEQKKYLFA